MEIFKGEILQKQVGGGLEYRQRGFFCSMDRAGRSYFIRKEEESSLSVCWRMTSSEY